MTRAERLKAIRERCEKATPGPWTAVERLGISHPQSKRALFRHSVHETTAILYPAVGIQRTWASNDAFFVANARTDVEWLLSEVERYREALEIIAGDESNPLRVIAKIALEDA